MEFEELVKQAQRRLRMMARQPRFTPGQVRRANALVTSVSAVVEKEAMELWHVAQPADLAHPTPAEARRLSLARHLSALLHFLLYHYQRIDNPGSALHLALAIKLVEPVADDLREIPRPLRRIVGPEAKPRIQRIVGAILMRCAQTMTDPVLLDVAIDLLTSAAAATREDHPNWPIDLNDLGIAHRMRFERTNNVKDLAYAISFGERAVQVTPERRRGRAWMLSNLSTSYRMQFECTVDAEDLAIAISLGEQAVQASYRKGGATPAMLSDLAGVYHARYRHMGTVGDLNLMIALVEQALSALPDPHPQRAGMLSNLAGIYSLRSAHSGTNADLRVAADFSDQAVAATSHSDPSRSRHLSNLAIAHQFLHSRTKDPAAPEGYRRRRGGRRLRARGASRLATHPFQSGRFLPGAVCAH